MNDKMLHFGVGLILGFVGRLAFGPGFGVLLAAIAGVAKEVYDATGRGTVDAGDFVWTVLGGVAADGGTELLLWVKAA